MQYLSKIENIRAYALGCKFVYLSENGVINIDGEILDFSQSSTFYLIEKEVYSATDYFLDSANRLVRPEYLRGMFFQKLHAGKIKKYTDDLMTYLFIDGIGNPKVSINRGEKEGSIVGLTATYYLLKNKNSLELFLISNSDLLWGINLEDLLEGDLRVFENDIFLSDNCLIMYIHEKGWKDYGLFIIDTTSSQLLIKTKDLGPHFHVHDEKVYSVGRNTQKLQIMEMNAYSIEKIDLCDELGDLVFETQCKPCFYKHKLYVALKNKGEDIYSYWGQINLKTFKLEYKTEMLRDPKKKISNSNRTFVSEIKANNKMVGVRVPGNILHLYEREPHKA